MKRSNSSAGGRTLFSLWTSRFASATVLAALALIAAPAAKADVVETFNLSGNFGSFFGPPVPFTGVINLDFSDNFAEETLQSMTITVNGRSVFNLDPSLGLALSASQGIINESNSSGDALSLTFGTPSPGLWAGFNQEAIAGGQVIFGGVTGLLLGATGEVTRDLSDPTILAPPPPITDPPDPPTLAVPELSTWAMMLIGLAGLGLAAKGRRALGFLRGRA
jgi:hypothetical protein